MNKRTVLYGALLVLVYWLAVAYLPTEMVTLLALLLTVPLLSLCFLPLLWYQTVPLRMEVAEVTSSEKPAICKVVVENRGVFPVSLAECVFEVKYAFSQKPFCFRIPLSLAAKDKTEVEVPLRFSYCGIASIRWKSLRVYDFLGVFFLPHPTKMVSGAVLLPDYTLMEIRNREQNMKDVSNADRHHATKVGEDPSEIVGVREMQPGDKLQQVHWKITAKSDEWMVKQFAAPLSCRVCLFVDLDYQNPVQYNSRMQMTLSLGLSLVEADCLFMIAWYQKEQGMSGRLVSDIAQLYEVFAQLLQQSQPTGAVDFSFAMGEIRFEDRLRQLIYITGDCPQSRCMELFEARKTWSDAVYVMSAREEKKRPSSKTESTEVAFAEVKSFAQDMIYSFQTDCLLEQLCLVEVFVL